MEVATAHMNALEQIGELLVCAIESGTSEKNLSVITAQPLLPEQQTMLQAALPAYNVTTVYVEDVNLSLGGYGFVLQDETVLLAPVSPEERSVFSSYRTRLVEYASPNRLLAGDEDRYQAIIVAAHNALARLVIMNFGVTEFAESSFATSVLAATDNFLLDAKSASTYYRDHYFRVLESLVNDGLLKRSRNTYKVLDPTALRLPYLKSYDQLLLEQQYLGTHESKASWADYMQTISAAGLPTYQTERPLTYQTPDQLKARTASPLPQVGSGTVDELVSEMAGLVEPYSINQSTANFTAFPEAGNSKAGVATAMLTPLWNQNVISVDKSAPIATFIEVQVIDWLRQLVGYDCAPTESALNLGGVTATGGVMSNTVGLLVARSMAFPKARTAGLVGAAKKPFLLIADKTLEHYSHKAAFWWLGLGEENVIPVKANGYNFDIADLRQKIATYNSGDNVVVAVVAMAGDSRTLTIQNIDEIHAETSKHGIWLHLDACQGGVGLFASNRDELCGNYKLADSISIDPHKGLALPYSSSFCLFKDQNALRVIAKSTDITIAKGSYDIGQITPFLGSRPFDALKVWALLKYHGLDGLAKNVDYRIELTKRWAACVNASKSFIALNDPELTAISFSIDPRKLGAGPIDAAQLSSLNKQLHDRCYQAGWLVIHCFDLIDFEDRLGLAETKPMRVLGTNFGNVLLDEYHFPKFIAYLESQLTELLMQTDIS